MAWALRGVEAALLYDFPPASPIASLPTTFLLSPAGCSWQAYTQACLCPGAYSVLPGQFLSSMVQPTGSTLITFPESFWTNGCRVKYNWFQRGKKRKIQCIEIGHESEYGHSLSAFSPTIYDTFLKKKGRNEKKRQAYLVHVGKIRLYMEGGIN